MSAAGIDLLTLCSVLYTVHTVYFIIHVFLTYTLPSINILNKFILNYSGDLSGVGAVHFNRNEIVICGWLNINCKHMLLSHKQENYRLQLPYTFLGSNVLCIVNLQIALRPHVTTAIPCLSPRSCHHNCQPEYLMRHHISLLSTGVIMRFS